MGLCAPRARQSSKALGHLQRLPAEWKEELPRVTLHTDSGEQHHLPPRICGEFQVWEDRTWKGACWLISPLRTHGPAVTQLPVYSTCLQMFFEHLKICIVGTTNYFWRRRPGPKRRWDLSGITQRFWDCMRLLFWFPAVSSPFTSPGRFCGWGQIVENLKTVGTQPQASVFLGLLLKESQSWCPLQTSRVL